MMDGWMFLDAKILPVLGDYGLQTIRFHHRLSLSLSLAVPSGSSASPGDRKHIFKEHDSGV